MKKNGLLQKLNKNKVIQEGLTFANAMSKRYIATNASSIAFYIFISIIPMFILLCSQLPFTGMSKAELTKAIVDITPESISDLVSSMISEAYSARVGVFSISIVILLWSSSKGMLALIRALDIIYDEKDSRNFLNMVVFSIFYTVCLLFIVSGLLVLYTKGRSAEEVIRSAIPTESIFEKLEEHGRDFNVLIIMTFIFAFIYKIAPAGKRKFIYQLPGALFSGIAISLFSVYFAIYNNGTNVYKSFYGSLTTVTIFLIWLYSCINIFLIGGVINSHYKDKFEILSDKIRNKRIKKKAAKNAAKKSHKDTKSSK